MIPIHDLDIVSIELLRDAIAFDGVEMPEERWADCDTLVRMDLASLSGARGPGRSWRRLTASELGKVSYATYEREQRA